MGLVLVPDSEVVGLSEEALHIAVKKKGKLKAKEKRKDIPI